MSILIKDIDWTQEPVTYEDWAPPRSESELRELSNRNRNAIKNAENILTDTFNKHGQITENDIRDAFGLPLLFLDCVVLKRS